MVIRYSSDTLKYSNPYGGKSSDRIYRECVMSVSVKEFQTLYTSAILLRTVNNGYIALG